jgi:hypothetical protein
MTALTIKKKLHDYINTAGIKKLQAIYTILEKEIEPEKDIYSDSFIKELNRRSREMKKGTIKTYRWEEMEKAARKIIRDKRKK